MHNSKGISLIEIVVTIAIAGVLMAIVAPRFFSSEDARLAMAAKMVCSDIAFVRQLAIACGKAKRIVFSSNSCSVADVATGSAVTYADRFPVSDLAGSYGFTVLTTGNISFNSMGELVAGSITTVTIRLSSNPALTKNITIETETGYAQVP